MDPYIKELSEVIRKTSMTNTYKMVWIRSILEVCCDDPTTKTIHFDQLSRKIFGYYWNQTFFFDLKQDSSKPPRIQQYVNTEIDKYVSKFGVHPQWFVKVENKVSIPISKISYELTRYVSKLFEKTPDKTYDLYKLDPKLRTVTPHHPQLIKDHSDVLIDLINYRWTQKLEEFNNSPRISQKVRSIEEGKIRRKPLKSFEKYLDLENPDRVCFITNKTMEKKSIDHTIPWSFLYSDDLWIIESKLQVVNIIIPPI